MFQLATTAEECAEVAVGQAVAAAAAAVVAVAVVVAAAVAAAVVAVAAAAVVAVVVVVAAVAAAAVVVVAVVEADPEAADLVGLPSDFGEQADSVAAWLACFEHSSTSVGLD